MSFILLLNTILHIHLHECSIITLFQHLSIAYTLLICTVLLYILVYQKRSLTKSLQNSNVLYTLKIRNKHTGIQCNPKKVVLAVMLSKINFSCCWIK